jgi:N-acetylglucosamine PTS system EIIB component
LYPRDGWFNAPMSQAEQLVAGLGGSSNIVEIEACITRLRTALADTGLVDETALKNAGAHGIMRAGSVVQVVVGPDADTIASEIEELL